MTELMNDILIGGAIIVAAVGIVYGAKKLGVTLVPHG